jgi:hypothetical protein
MPISNKKRRRGKKKGRSLKALRRSKLAANSRRRSRAAK